MQVSNSSKLTISPRCWPRPKFPRSQSYRASVGSAPQPPGTRHHRTALEVLWPYLDRSELFSPCRRNLHNIKQVVWMLWLIGVLLYMDPTLQSTKFRGLYTSLNLCRPRLLPTYKNKIKEDVFDYTQHCVKRGQGRYSTSNSICAKQFIARMSLLSNLTVLASG